MYLVRKIERAKWVGSDQADSRIKADVVASCIRPHRSELSVWFAADDSDLENATLAMLAATNKLDTIDMVILPQAEIEGAGLSLVASVPSAGPLSLRPRHRDITDLDLDSLKKVAQIVQRQLVARQEKRLTLKQCREILEGAIEANKFTAAELHQDLSRKLKSA